MTDEYLCNNISANKSKSLDARLKTINEFGCLSDTKKELCKLVELGEYPCSGCRKNADTCTDRMCIPWILWAKMKWQNIQQAAREKGWNG